MKLHAMLAAATLLAASGAQAQTAGTYSFSYGFDAGATVSGVLTGTLSADGNLFNITGVTSYAVNGVAVTDKLTFGSDDVLLSMTPGFDIKVDPNTIPVATLNASRLDFYIASTSNPEIFEAAVGNVGAAEFGDGIGATAGFGNSDGLRAFVPGSYNARFAALAVPEPATWAMMVLGFGLVGAGLRGRRQQTRVTFG